MWTRVLASASESSRCASSSTRHREAMSLTVLTFPDPQVVCQELQVDLGRCCSELDKVPAQKEGLRQQQARLRLVERIPRFSQKAAEVDRLLRGMDSRVEELQQEKLRLDRELNQLMREPCSPVGCHLRVVTPLRCVD